MSLNSMCAYVLKYASLKACALSTHRVTCKANLQRCDWSLRCLLMLWYLRRRCSLATPLPLQPLRPACLWGCVTVYVCEGGGGTNREVEGRRRQEQLPLVLHTALPPLPDVCVCVCVEILHTHTHIHTYTHMCVQTVNGGWDRDRFERRIFIYINYACYMHL